MANPKPETWTMTVYPTETAAFTAGGNMVAKLCTEGKPNAGLRVLKTDKGFKVLILPEQHDRDIPFYL